MKMDRVPKLHRQSVRMKEFDYAMDARWFVTVCTHERKCTLGEIVEEDGEYVMRLSDMGKIVEECWYAIPDHFPNVILDEFVIMPNHVHGLLEIIDTSHVSGTSGDKNSATNGRGVACYASEIPQSCRGTACRAPTNSDNANCEQLEKFGKPTSHSLPTILRSFKSVVTKRVNELYKNHEPFWQRNYYEHGIRTDLELQRIQNYIKENPLMWNEDEDNPANLSKRR